MKKIVVKIGSVDYELLDPKTNGISPSVCYPCKILMVGSITIDAGIERGFYYASPRNAFWKLVDGVWGTNGVFLDLKEHLNANFKDFSANKKTEQDFILERNRIIKLFREELANRYISICDIFETCYIKKGSTNDADIYIKNSGVSICHKYLPVSYIDIILSVYFANKGCKIVVNSCYVEACLREYLEEYLSAKRITPRQFKDILANTIRVVSPSGALRKSHAVKLADWKSKLSPFI